MMLKALMLVMVTVLFGTAGMDCTNVYLNCPTSTEGSLGGLYIR
jgi:hypothetical protein